MRRRTILGLLGGTAIVTAVGIVSVVACLRWFFNAVDSPKDHCRGMVATLQSTADPQALRRACAELVQRYPNGGTHRLAMEELPDPVRQVMKSLSLAEATITEGSVLRLDTPGGFAAYGIDIVPQGSFSAPSTNSQGMTMAPWKDGISVWYLNQ